ncbi:TonB-dependent receptor [Sphingomonas sp. UYEF23]|uniref:TonB-dependent receptor n=1 Tax=Sphingomonas sp. UYEF23 TaxID=1756408 RepID=UPI0033990EC9
MIKPVGLLTTCAAIAIASGATPARAQSVSTPATSPADPAPADPQADPNTADIIVHALRRSETLQSVPAAITAFTATRIEEAGITKPADFIAQTPNVTLVQTQNAGTSFVVIRGIGQARNSEPSVAVVVDGVQQVNPSQFNRELFDVDQIEVLKGPQGGVYGRNAIGGAIVITTKAPTDTLTGRFKGGFDNGPGFRVQGVLSGPITKGGDLKFRAGLSYYDTNGFIPNVYTGKNADPVRDLSGSAQLLWEPSSTLSFDLRGSVDRLRTRGYYFNIVSDVNDTSVPVQVNNPGIDNRDIYDVSAKVSYDAGFGTFTSITAYDRLTEIVTGDGTDFKPREQSLLYGYFGFDLAQSQFLQVEAVSQEVRFASPVYRPFSFIVGAYGLHTDRYISTSNLKDIGEGVFPVYRTPSTNPRSPQYSFLADSQNNLAWAVFANVNWKLALGLEFDGSLRYDSDRRRQTTLTPTAYLPNVPGFPQGLTGDVRAKTFKELQPKATLRYKVGNPLLVYASFSRGFRSGGFNQTGVAAIAASSGVVGIRDVYDAEVATTYEIGAKTQWFDHQLDINVAAYTTKSQNGYFFFYLATNGTQNLGNVPEARYKGFEVEVNARPMRGWELNAGFGYTDSAIRKFPDPTVIGNHAPLVSEYTVNAGTQYKWALGGSGIEAVARVDYQLLGKTWFDVANSTVRRPVGLVNTRLGLQRNNSWTVTAFAKNLTNRLYNAEYAPGGFVFKAEPRQYGVEFTKTF